MTLSIPDGLIRALRENRLPSRVEVWHVEREEWVSLAAHPAARRALESIGSYLPATDSLGPIEPTAPVGEVAPEEVAPDVVEPEAVEAEAVPPPDVPAPESEPAPEPSPPEPEAPVLAAAHEFIPPPLPVPPAAVEPEEPEPEVLINILSDAPPTVPPAARSSRLDITPPPKQHERRSRDTRPAWERRQSEAALPPPVEPVPAPASGFRLRQIPRQLMIGGGIVAAIALLFFLKGRSGDTKSADRQQRVTTAEKNPAAVPAPPESVPEVLPPLPVDSGDTAPQVAALELQGIPGAGPEADLETSLRLANALMWNPAQDFGSPAGVLRARRKVEAVLNSIQAYRVDMRRLAAGGGGARLGDRLEPFGEASRIDDVVRAMGAAVNKLEDLEGRFVVRGGTLEFDRAEDARRYNELRDRADSLLRAPVELDPRPIIRPPRRLVTRLLSTLPGGMARGSGP